MIFNFCKQGSNSYIVTLFLLLLIVTNLSKNLFIFAPIFICPHCYNVHIIPVENNFSIITKRKLTENELRTDEKKCLQISANIT